MCIPFIPFFFSYHHWICVFLSLSHDKGPTFNLCLVTATQTTAAALQSNIKRRTPASMKTQGQMAKSLQQGGCWRVMKRLQRHPPTPIFRIKRQHNWQTEDHQPHYLLRRQRYLKRCLCESLKQRQEREIFQLVTERHHLQRAWRKDSDKEEVGQRNLWRQINTRLKQLPLGLHSSSLSFQHGTVSKKLPDATTKIPLPLQFGLQAGEDEK